MIRTSLYLPEDLHQRLLVLSQRKGQSFSRLARVLFNQALDRPEYHDVLKTYEALDRLDGIGDSDIVDASTTVDEVLYGEHGAWLGDRGEVGLWTLMPRKASHDR
jgi:predicted DNA-binding protein